MNNLNLDSQKLYIVLEVSKTPEKYIHLPLATSDKVGKLAARKIDFKAMASNLWQTLLITINRLRLAMTYGSWANNTNLIKILSEQISIIEKSKDPAQFSVVLKTDQATREILQLCKYLKASSESTEEDVVKVETLTSKIQNLISGKIIKFSTTPTSQGSQSQSVSIASQTTAITEAQQSGEQETPEGRESHTEEPLQERPLQTQEKTTRSESNNEEPTLLQGFSSISRETSEGGECNEEESRILQNPSEREASIEPKISQVQEPVQTETQAPPTLKRKKVVHLNTRSSLSLFRVTVFLLGLAAVITGGLYAYVPSASRGNQVSGPNPHDFDNPEEQSFFDQIDLSIKQGLHGEKFRDNGERNNRRTVMKNYRDWEKVELHLKKIETSLMQTEAYPTTVEALKERIKNSLKTDLGLKFYHSRNKLIRSFFISPATTDLEYAQILKLGKKIGGENSVLADECDEELIRLGEDTGAIEHNRALVHIPSIPEITPYNVDKHLASMEAHQHRIDLQSPDIRKKSYMKLAYAELLCASHGVKNIRNNDKELNPKHRDDQELFVNGVKHLKLALTNDQGELVYESSNEMERALLGETVHNLGDSTEKFNSESSIKDLKEIQKIFPPVTYHTNR